MEVPQAEQIHLLCEKIMTDKADFNATTITMLMDGNHVTFVDVVAHISQYVSHFFPTRSTSNFSVLKFSGYQCDVDPFLDTYQMTSGVFVITAATAVQLLVGDTLFLVSTAALWFGDTIEISLFNANIIRMLTLRYALTQSGTRPS